MDGVATNGFIGNVGVSLNGAPPDPMPIGQPVVLTTNGRGFNPAELAEMFVNKLLAVSADLPPDQLAAAHAYRDRILALATVYMNHAQKSQNTTTFNELMNAGHADAAEIVRKL
jgi:hypothetical protein